MHVAQFVHRYPPALGGAEAWAARLSRHLVARGHQVTVFTTTAVELSAFTRRGSAELPAGTTVEDGVRVRRFRPGLRFPGRRLALKAASLVPVRPWQAATQHWAPIPVGMRRAAREDAGDANVVHAVAFPYAPVIAAAYRLARWRRVPFIVTPFLHLGDLEDPKDPIRRAYTAPHLRSLLRRADRVLVQTPTEAQAVRQMGVGSDRVVLQGLGVAPEDCTGGSRIRARAAWGVSDGEAVIGHLANLSAEKGTIDLLRAAAELHDRGVPLRVVLAGSAMPAFTKFRAGFGPAAWLTDLGPLTDSAKRDFFAGIDGFALPSRSDSFGLVFLEAWANRIPVIGYRSGGVADVIRHESDGLLVRPGDLTGLAEALRRVAVDATARRAWGRAGEERVRREFRWADKLQIAEAALTNWA
jgi:glycosyltransferase involved in cell wall biosynthesis